MSDPKPPAPPSPFKGVAWMRLLELRHALAALDRAAPGDNPTRDCLDRMAYGYGPEADRLREHDQRLAREAAARAAPGDDPAKETR
jgi:hypothetical protein